MTGRSESSVGRLSATQQSLHGTAGVTALRRTCKRHNWAVRVVSFWYGVCSLSRIRFTECFRPSTRPVTIFSTSGGGGDAR